MDVQKVDMFIMTNAKYFEGHQLTFIRERLLELDDSHWMLLSTTSFQDPSTNLIISVIAGSFGVDRFLIGQVGLGIAKLLTCGGLGIWAIVDWFLIMKLTKEKNLEKIQKYMY